MNELAQGALNDRAMQARICHAPRVALPVEIIGLLRPTIELVWEDGHRTVYPARELRLRCRCAFCVDEWTRAPLLDPATVPETVCATAIHIVGNYAMSVDWSDRHSTGIYAFRDLRAGCPCPECAAGR
jgi:ATP-binding protein involved in chromosome partitioning